MNKIFKVIFNRQTGTFQAVQETAKGQHKTQSSQGNKTKTAKIVKAVLRPLTIAMTLLASSIAMASPTGGQVTAGQATINQNGLTTNINQSSQNAAINWQSFNIAKNETVNFNQPNAQSVTLNRVIGNERSIIDGAMNANGKVFISNANGMLIGKDAKINVGSLVATTANISDDDFMNGNYRLNGGENGSVENLGQISVPKGGVVALVAPIVKNGGTITAPQANVLLASAESFSITLPDNANFSYTLDKGMLQGLIDNGGAILADGGRVVLTAQGVDTVKKSLIKHTGAIQANTVSNNNGVIELLGDLDNSALTVSGSLKAEAKESGDGGFIETSASQVKIEDSAEVSTLAQNGRTGNWLIDPNDIIIANGTGVKPDGTPYTKDEVTANGLTIANQLTKSNVTIQSTKGKSEGKGDVIIDDEITGGNPHTNPVHTLTLSAYNDIHINKNIDLKGAVKLALEYGSNNSSESDVKFNNKSRINLPEGKTLSVQKGSSGKYELLVVHSLPSGQDFLNKDIAIGKDIDMSGINRSNGWYFPKNHDSYYGSLWGLGHNIDNLTITGTNEVGLVPKLDGGVIRDLNLNNVNITGNENVGGIIGKAYSHGTPTKIQNIDISGSISGNKSIGGIIGNAELKGTGGGLYGTDGTIDVEKININLTVKGGDNVGGIVGHSYLVGYGAGGAVLDINKVNTNNSQIIGQDNVGGVVGNTEVASTGIARLEIEQSAITSNISGNNNIGGLIGNSSVMSGGSGFQHGWSDIFIRDNYSNANIQGKNNVGGLIGKLKTNSGISEVERVYFMTQSKGDSNIDIGIGSTELVNSSNFEIKFKDSFFDKTKISQSDKNGLKGKTTKEMQQKSTFTNAGWDFDNVWYINAGEMPKLHAHKKGTITINPNTPNLTDLNIQANNLSKVYDGKPVENEEQLRLIAKENGYGDIVTVTGLKNGDTLAKLGTLRYDSEGNTWQNAKDVDEYKIIPSGLTGGQDYEIKYGEGALTVTPETLTVQLLPNFFDNTISKDGKTFADIPTSAIGFIAKGLVKGEDFKLSGLNPINIDSKNLTEGQKAELMAKGVDFTVGKKDNYKIEIKPSYLVYLPELKDMTYFPKLGNKNDQERVKAYKQLFDSVRDELILAGDYVYRSDFGRNGRALDSFDNYENVNDRYRLPDNIKIATQANGKPATYDLGGNLQMAVYQKDENKSQYIIAFRGSQEGEDWWTNAKTIGLTSNQDTYLRASKTAKNFIDSVQTNGKNFEFVFTGHSLGGSLAQFVGASLDLPNSKVVTFNTAPLRPILWEKINHKQPTNIKHENITNIIFDNDMLQYIKSLIATGHQPSYLKKPEKISLIGGTAVNDHLYGHINLDRVITNTFSELYQNQSSAHVKPTWSFKPLSTWQKRRVNASIFTFKHLISPSISVNDAARDIMPKPINDVLALAEKPIEFVLKESIDEISNGVNLLNNLSEYAGNELANTVHGANNLSQDIGNELANAVHSANTASQNIADYLYSHYYEWRNTTYNDLQNSMSAFDNSYRDYDKSELPNALKLLIQTDRLAGTDISSFDVRNVMKSLYIAYHLKSYDEKTVKTLFQQAKQSHRRALMARYDTAKDRVFKATIAQQIRIFDQFTFEKWIAKKGTLNIDAYGKFFNNVISGICYTPLLITPNVVCDISPTPII